MQHAFEHNPTGKKQPVLVVERGGDVMTRQNIRTAILANLRARQVRENRKVREEKPTRTVTLYV
jgi:hypothetical protein